MLEIVARVLFFVLATMVVIGGIALLADVIWRRLLPNQPNMELHPCQRGDSDTRFVVLPTYQKQTRLLMENVIRQLAEYGSVYRIDDTGVRLNTESIVFQMPGLLHLDRQIVIVAPGPSLMLAIDIANELERFPVVGREVSIITVDGIPSSNYISSKSLEVARLPLGPIANWLVSQVRRFKKWTRWNYTPSLWRDYMRFVHTWGPEGRPSASLVYIRSEQTEEEALFMAPNLAGHLVAGGLIETLTVPGADRLDIQLYPQRYETAVARALELLEIERVG